MLKVGTTYPTRATVWNGEASMPLRQVTVLQLIPGGLMVECESVDGWRGWLNTWELEDEPEEDKP